MNKQVEQVRAEVYRRFLKAGIHEGVSSIRAVELKSLLSFIDSIPVEPKFKVGDVVRSTNGAILTIIGMGQYCYHCDNDYSFGFDIQDEFELVEEPVAEDLEKAAKNHAAERYRVTRDRELAEKCKWSFITGAKWQKEKDLK